MRVFVVVHIWKDTEDHCDFIDVSLKELEAYKLCNSLNQRNEKEIKGNSRAIKTE